MISTGELSKMFSVSSGGKENILQNAKKTIEQMGNEIVRGVDMLEEFGEAGE